MELPIKTLICRNDITSCRNLNCIVHGNIVCARELYNAILKLYYETTHGMCMTLYFILRQIRHNKRIELERYPYQIYDDIRENISYIKYDCGYLIGLSGIPQIIIDDVKDIFLKVDHTRLEYACRAVILIEELAPELKRPIYDYYHFDDELYAEQDDVCTEKVYDDNDYTSLGVMVPINMREFYYKLEKLTDHIQFFDRHEGHVINITYNNGDIYAKNNWHTGKLNRRSKDIK